MFVAYDNGQGSMPVVFLCLFAFLTGMGGCSAFGGAIKTGILHQELYLIL
jgi:hypothetical protein